MIRKTDSGYVVYSEKGKKLSRAYSPKTAASKRLREIEYFKQKNQRYKRVEDKKLRGASGEIDYDKKTIRVNPRKGDVINTIVHEETHRKYPKKSEEWVKKEAKRVENNLSLNDAAKLIKRYIRNGQ